MVSGGVLASLVYVLVSGSVVDMHVSWILLASFITGLGGSYAACLNTAASYLTQVTKDHYLVNLISIKQMFW